ncbi:MAG: RibD family protein [Micrococcales bacterium]|nr:RibD family protein [Micrococcales bacterium]
MDSPAQVPVPDAPGVQEAWRLLLAGRVSPPGTAEADDSALMDRYGPLVAAGSPVTIAQLGQSLDGFIASRTGDAEFVTGSDDREHLHRMRALVDAVVVGATTVLADDCRLTVRAVPGPDPVRVVLDPRGRVSRDAHVLTDGASPTLWLRAAGSPAGDVGDVPPHVRIVRLPVAPGAGFDLVAVLEQLRRRGLGRVLVEGGGQLVSAFVAARLVDRLYVTTAPLLIGDGVPGIRFTGADALSGALSGPSRRFILGQDVCTELLLTSATAPHHAEQQQRAAGQHGDERQ